MGDMAGFLLFLFMLIGFVALLYFAENAKDNASIRIRDEVYKRGGVNVQVMRVNERDRDNWTFEVSYRDAQNVQHRTKCKVRVSLFDNGSPIYWMVDLQLPVVSKEATAVLPTPPLSSKEQIISDLTAENQRLQAQLDKRQQADEQ
jgi:hypothetical protein